MSRYLGNYAITSPYGYRQLVGFHYGIDFGTPVGTPIPAIEAGKVVFARETAGLNNTRELVIIIQSGGSFVWYGHLNRFLVKTGQVVTRGQIIAESGKTGYVTGPHLHIEERQGQWGTKNGLYDYPTIDITPRVNHYESEDDMDAERELEIAVLSLAQRGYTKDELAKYKESRLQPYTFAQQNVPNVIAEERDRKAFAEAWLQQAWDWPQDLDAEYAKWKADGRPLPEYIQKTAPNPLARRIEELQQQVQDLQGQLEGNPSAAAQKLKELDAIIHRA